MEFCVILSDAHPKRTIEMQNEKQQTKLERLEAVIDRRQHDLFRFAYMRTGSRADAEDIVQEVLLRLFRSEEEMSRIDDVERYLWRSIANRCRDFHRRRRFVATGLEHAAEEVAPDDREMHEEYLRIERLLAELPDEQRETVRLRCTDHLTFAEIAELTDTSEATAKSRWRYAIDRIRKSFFN